MPGGAGIDALFADALSGLIGNGANEGEKHAEMVEHPKHYNQGTIECIDAIRESMTNEAFCGFCKGNVMKYVWRYEERHWIEDLQKARVYLDWLIEHYRRLSSDHFIYRFGVASKSAAHCRGHRMRFDLRYYNY